MIKFDFAVDFSTPDLAKVRNWINAVAEIHGYTVKRLSYRFCDDSEILDVNRKFLNHDYYTDIITFDYTASHRLAGDMIISLDTVKSNAAQIGEDVTKEFLRVIIHGVLHLCGINDKGPGEREIMEKQENDALRIWYNQFAEEEDK